MGPLKAALGKAKLFLDMYSIPGLVYLKTLGRRAAVRESKAIKHHSLRCPAKILPTRE